MINLSKYFNDGLVIDESLIFSGTGQTTDDLLYELSKHGLQVSYIDTSGSLIRVPVSAGTNYGPDRGGKRSGWYACNILDDNIFCTFGNWKSGLESKWSSVNTNKLSIQQQEDLQKKLQIAKENAEKEKKQRQNEVASDCRALFDSYAKVTEHQYLSTKNVKSHSLRANKKLLVVPIYSIETQEIRSLQYIGVDGQKNFKSASEVRGNIYPLGFDWHELPNLETLVIAEGYATCASINEATNLPCVCVFSANFCLDALTKLRTKTPAKFILALDHDQSGLGQKKAEECASALGNTVIRIPTEPGDYNDMANKHGLERVRQEIMAQGLGLRQYSIKDLVATPPPRAWLVDRLLEQSKPVILASIGGVGKSMLSLDLALKVSRGRGTWLDNKIVRGGNAVILSSEDDRLEIHRRINALDPQDQRFSAPYDVYAYTIPDTGKPLILLRENNQGLHLTPEAEELMNDLEAIPNLELVVIDPVQSFVSAPITTSQEASQMYGQFCATISARFNCVCLSIHHMSKSGLSETEDTMQARQNIRGSSSLVDSMRGAIAIWLAPESEAERICSEQGVDYDRLRVVKCGVVKTNSSEVDTKVKTLFRKNAVLEPLKEGDISW